MSRPLIIFEWNGDAMVPDHRFTKLCDEEFVVGGRYKMEALEERSLVSHNHYFACIYEAWKTLPERFSDRFPTAEHLRKFALIKSGNANERSIVCSSNAEALRVASFIKPIDEFAVVIVSESTVKAYTAKSQSVRSMGKEEFQKSKTAVLETVSDMIGVDPATLAAEAEQTIKPNTGATPHAAGESAAPTQDLRAPPTTISRVRTGD